MTGWEREVGKLGKRGECTLKNQIEESVTIQIKTTLIFSGGHSEHTQCYGSL